MIDALVHALAAYTATEPGPNPYYTAIDGLMILRSDHEKPPAHLIFKPALCIVAQGAKWAMFGDRRFDYRAGQALVVNVELPLFGRVAEASPTEPYLGMVIEFDLGIMREVLEALDAPPAPGDPATGAVFVSEIAGPLADCALRMVRLLGTPAAIPVLHPTIMRELCYWLLTGPHGGDVARIALANNHPKRIISAIHVLRERFTQGVRIEELAAVAQLSTSAFHRQFKALTSLTPLQYQKQLRLLEARRLMTAEGVNVETAAFSVGYESASQFSREYSRMFGASPRRDMTASKRLAA